MCRGPNRMLLYESGPSSPEAIAYLSALWRYTANFACFASFPSWLPAHHIIRIGGNDSEVVSSSVFATALVVRPFVGSDSVGRKILVVRRAVLAASKCYTS